MLLFGSSLHGRALLLAALVALGAAGCGGESAGADASPLGPDAAVGSDGGVLESCNPVSQTGCPGGLKCSLRPAADEQAPPQLECVPAEGALGLNAACTLATAEDPDDCAPGLVCGGGGSPRCLEFCSQEPADTCSGAQACAIAIEIDDPEIVLAYLCAPTCDPLLQSCAAADEACYPSRNGTACAPIGGGLVPAEEGDICEFANSCAEGLGCFRIGAAFEFTCQKICNPDGISEPSCKPAQTCNQVEDEVWGICIDSA